MSKTNITVRFSDIDMAGNVHNSKYLSYFEQARIDFLTEISGLNWDWRKQGLSSYKMLKYVTKNNGIASRI